MKISETYSVYVNAMIRTDHGIKSETVAIEVFDNYPTTQLLKPLWDKMVARGWQVISLHVGKTVYKEDDK